MNNERINKPEYIIVHHIGGSDAEPLADTSDQTFEDVNAWHRISPRVWLGKLSSLGYAIGYHYFIDKQGKLTQGRADSDEGAHCVGYNLKSIGICMAGNFDRTLPNFNQTEALIKIVKEKMKQYNIPLDKVVPHRTFANKTCYGRNLSDIWLKEILSDKIIAGEPCLAEKEIIKSKDSVIENLKALLKSIINLGK